MNFKKKNSKYIKNISTIDKVFYYSIRDKISLYNEYDLICDIYTVISELEYFGQITRKYLYPLCQCILYGILKNELLFFSMNSNALIKNIKQLREKPQYKYLLSI